MALKDIQERLYSREQQDPTAGEAAPEQASSGSRVTRPASTRKSSPIGRASQRRDWKAASTAALRRKKKADQLARGKRPRWQIVTLFVSLAVVLIVVGVLSYLFIFRDRDTFDPSSITMEILAPDSVASGEEITYTVRISNGSATALTNAELFFEKPNGFSVIGGDGEGSGSTVLSRPLDDIGAGSVGLVEFRGPILGERNSIKSASATLRYVPENFPESSFEAQASRDVVISSVPLTLSGSAQTEVASGGEVVYTLSYLNNSTAVYEDLILDVTYPQGFEFLSASPSPTSRDNIWEIGDLSRTAEPQQIEIRGRLSGSEGESKVFAARLFSRIDGSEIVFAEDRVSVLISQSPFTLSQKVNGSLASVANLGEQLAYTVEYTNASDIPLSRAIVNVQVQSRALDLASLQVDSGAFDAATSTISWDASGVPALANLAPGASGVVTFRVDVLDLLQIDSNDDKNFDIVTVATIDSPDVPQPVAANKIVTSNTLQLKVNSRLLVQAKGFYNDPSGAVNSGPIPPQVGVKTTYTVHWQIINVNNDVSGTTVRAVLPPGVRFEGQVSVTGGNNLRFDERTKELVWELGNVAAQTGLRIPSQEAIFTISITPAPADAGGVVQLTDGGGAATITGKDAFTDQDLSHTAPSFTTELPDDPTINQGGAVVVAP